MAKRTIPTLPEWQCAVCGYRLQYPVQDDLTHVAWHEAGHAVMRWRLGEPPGAICLHPDGSGFSAPATPGQLRPTHDLLLITLAGIAAEVGGRPILNLETSKADDLDEALEMLTPDYIAWRFAPHTRTQQEALREYYEQARTLIWKDFDYVEAVAEALLAASSLSADDLREMLPAPGDKTEEGG